MKKANTTIHRNDNNALIGPIIIIAHMSRPKIIPMANAINIIPNNLFTVFIIIKGIYCYITSCGEVVFCKTSLTV